MNIHYYMGSMRTAKQAREIGLSVGSAKGTEAPRTRSGQTYPGGKALRRAFAKLRARKADRDETLAGNNQLNPGAFKMPGSMAA